MSIATELDKLKARRDSIVTAITDKGGTCESGATLAACATAIGTIPSGGDVDPTTWDYNPLEATAKTIGGVNVSTNDHIKIYGSDKNSYTCEEWYALTDKPEPVGFDMEVCHEHFVIYLYNFSQNDKYTYKDVTGTASQTDGMLAHSQYSHPMMSSDTVTGSWTDANGTTAKATASGDDIILTSTNSPKTWVIAKNCGYRYAFMDSVDNSHDRTEALYAMSEWFRHRAAIDSGLTTTEADGTEGEVTIVTEDDGEMYFYVNGEKTEKLAKYNIHSMMTGSNPTSTIIDAIYAKQKTNGINMNSSTILTPGAKGAEAYAYNGKWMIVTPILSRASATFSLDYNVQDAPAVYYCKNIMQPKYGDELMMPSERMMEGYYLNRSKIINSMISFLKSSAGGTCSVNSSISAVVWCAPRCSANAAWYVSTSNGNMYYYSAYTRFATLCASAL